MPKSALGRNIDIIETKRYYSLSDYFQLYEWYYKSNDQVIKDIASLENQKVLPFNCLWGLRWHAFCVGLIAIRFYILYFFEKRISARSLKRITKANETSHRQSLVSMSQKKVNNINFYKKIMITFGRDDGDIAHFNHICYGFICLRHQKWRHSFWNIRFTWSSKICLIFNFQPDVGSIPAVYTFDMIRYLIWKNICR